MFTNGVCANSRAYLSRVAAGVVNNIATLTMPANGNNLHII
jgi:hypothetical protein